MSQNEEIAPKVQKEDKDPERVSLSFLGLKFSAENPGRRTLVLVCVFIGFFIALLLIFKYYAVGTAIAAASLNKIGQVAGFLKK